MLGGKNMKIQRAAPGLFGEVLTRRDDERYTTHVYSCPKECSKCKSTNIQFIIDEQYFIEEGYHFHNRGEGEFLEIEIYFYCNDCEHWEDVYRLFFDEKRYEAWRDTLLEKLEKLSKEKMKQRPS